MRWDGGDIGWSELQHSNKLQCSYTDLMGLASLSDPFNLNPSHGNHTSKLRDSQHHIMHSESLLGIYSRSL